MIHEIQIADVASGLPALLESVERGDTLVIKRQGLVVARLVPEPGAAAPVPMGGWYMRTPLPLACITTEGLSESPGGDSRCSCSQCFEMRRGGASQGI